MFGWEFPPHISGGLGTACYGLTKGMSKIKDLEVIFVVPKAYGDEDEQAIKLVGAGDIPLKITKIPEYSENIKNLEYIEVGSNIIPYLSPEEYYQRLNQQMNEKRYLIETDEKGRIKFTGKYGISLFKEIYNYSLIASQIAEMYDFDVIHAHDWLTYPAGIAAQSISKKPLVVHVHATDFDRSGGSVNPAVFNIEKEGMNKANKVITVSNLTRNTVINNYQIPENKVTTVYNAVEPLDYKFTKNPKTMNEKVVTFLGRITLQKGPEYFIEAAYKVIKRMPNVRFVMAGSGDMMEQMVLRAAKLGITDRFHFTGFLKGNDVYKMFNHSDLYIMPSISEPFGISPLEAMQSGVPVIISKQSGVSEILKHAIKIDFWDIDKMANAIYAILNYPSLANTIKNNGLIEANNLKWEESAKQVYKVYESCLQS